MFECPNVIEDLTLILGLDEELASAESTSERDDCVPSIRVLATASRRR
jgi:hypothetical protein